MTFVEDEFWLDVEEEDDEWDEDDLDLPRGTKVRSERLEGVAFVVQAVQGDWVRIRAYGDDITYDQERCTLVKITDDEFCLMCGQLGCDHGGRN